MIKTMWTKSIIAWSKIRENEHLKRAMEIALAGNHTICVVGRQENGERWLKDILGNLLTFLEPCPCGCWGDITQVCICTARKIMDYRKQAWYRKALLCDIRTQIFAPRGYTHGHELESFEDVFKRIKFMKQVDNKWTVYANELFERSVGSLGLSAMAQESVKRVALTIASLDYEKGIDAQHVAEAIQYQTLK